MNGIMGDLYAQSRIVCHPLVPGEFHGYVKRTWKERLFSLPWKPQKKVKWVDRPAVAYVANGVAYLDPVTYKKIMDQLQKESQENEQKK